MLQPAQFFVKKRSSEKSEVLVAMSVLDTKSCGAETVPELVTSPQTTLPVDAPPLVAVKAQSRLSQSSGPAEAAPVIVSVAPVTAPVAAKLAAVAAPEAVSVPVDTSPTVVTGRPADAQRAARHGAGGRQRGSGDGAGGCERCAGDCARGVHARCEHVRAVHVALRSESVQSGRAREGQQVGQQASRRPSLPRRRWP